MAQPFGISFLLLLPTFSSAVRVKIKTHELSAFTCPDECVECCSSKVATKFKCVLWDAGDLPPDRECESPTGRANNPEEKKTHCDFLEGEAAELEVCKTLSTLEYVQSKGISEPLGLFSDWRYWVMEKFLWPLQSKMKGAKVTRMNVKLQSLHLLHPIKHAGSLKGSARRARQARSAEDLIKANNWVLTEQMLKKPELASLRSIEPFEVVSLGPKQGFLIVSGNGRTAALRWAFPPGSEGFEKLRVEVRMYTVDVDKKGATSLLLANGATAYEKLAPPDLSDDKVLEWAETQEVKEALETDFTTWMGW